MNETLKQELKDVLHLSDEIIADIESKLGVVEPDDMKLVTQEMLVSIGLLPVPAVKVFNYYHPVVVPEPNTTTTSVSTPTTNPFGAGGPTIIVRSGRPEDMPLKELLDSIAGGEHTLDYLNAVRKYSRGRKVFVRAEGSDIMDVTSTLELIQYADGGDDIPEFWGENAQPTETLEEYLNQTFYANPITGKRLPKGHAWLKVPEERRILAAYARIANKLTGSEDEITLINELGQADLTSRWIPFNKAFRLDEKKGMKNVIEARASIIWHPKTGSSRVLSDGDHRRLDSEERPTY